MNRELWQAVDQPSRNDAKSEPVSLTLRPVRDGTPVKLYVAVRHDVVATLRWEVGLKIGLALGLVGRTAGWIRLAPDRNGRGLTSLGRFGAAKTLVAIMHPGEELARWTGPRMGCEWSVNDSEQALLCRIPWIFEEAAADAAEAA
jgi:hypothetical protein